MVKVRYKNDGTEGSSGQFNVVSLSEVLVQGDWGADSAYQSDLDVFLNSTGEWKDMRQAFRDHDLITNNENTRFFEPCSEDDRRRGYTE